MTAEPHHVKAILATQFDDFDKGRWKSSQYHVDKDRSSMTTLGPMFYSQFRSLLGEGVFNADGKPSISLPWSVTDHDKAKCGSTYIFTISLRIFDL